MVVSFNNQIGLSLDHLVSKEIFSLIILMMVHDGFHDFYNDKSKDDFLDLFKKYIVVDSPAAVADTTVSGGAGTAPPLAAAIGEEPPGDRGHRVGRFPGPEIEGLENFENVLDETNILLNELILKYNYLFIKETIKEHYDRYYIVLKDEIRVSIEKYLNALHRFGLGGTGNYNTLKGYYMTYFRTLSDGDYSNLNHYMSNTIGILEGIKTLAEANILSSNHSSLVRSIGGEIVSRMDESIIRMDESIIISEQLSEKSLALLRRSDLPLQTRFELHRILKEIYDELYSSLKNRINIKIFDHIFTNTFELLVSSCNYEGCKIDETLNIGKEFIIFEFYKLRSFESNLTPEEKQVCIDMFNQIDTNRDGNISQVELITALRLNISVLSSLTNAPVSIQEVINIPIPENDNPESIAAFTRTFQKIDKDGHEADEGRGISQVEFTNYYSTIKNNEKIKVTFSGDLEILRKYLTPDNPDNFKTKDFEDFYYEELFSGLMEETEEEYRTMNNKRKPGINVSENETSQTETIPLAQQALVVEGSDEGELEYTQSLAVSPTTSPQYRQNSPVEESQAFTPTTSPQSRSLRDGQHSPAAIAPDSPGGIQVMDIVEEKSDIRSGKRLKGAPPPPPVPNTGGNPVISGGADSSAITPIILRECVDFFNRINRYLNELNSKTNIDDTYKEFFELFTDKKPEWWTDGDSSTVSTFDENEYDETAKPEIIRLLTFIEGTPTTDISNYKGQLESINSIIYIYESFKKFFNNKLYSKVKTKSDNIDLKIPGKSNDLYDELSITYNYNGKDKKIYFSIVEFIYIMYMRYEMDIKNIPHRELKLDIRNSFVINAYTFGENALKRTRPGYETKERFIVYQALKEKIENFCNDGRGDSFRGRSNIEGLKLMISTPSQELFNKFIDNEELLNNFDNLINILNKLKKYIERFVPYIDTSVKKKMSVSEKDDWAKIFKCFSEDYVNKLGNIGTNDYKSMFGEIIRYGNETNITTSDMKKGDSLDKEIWKKLGSKHETFDKIHGSIGKIVNNAMPPQMKKLFKLNYLCNTSILDPMGTFGSCTRVPFGRSGYDLKYKISYDHENYIYIILPVKAINDVSIVNGKVEVVVNGEHMVKDEFTLTHFNSEEPFSISNIVNQLRPITGSALDQEKARKDNRNILFRKFLGDFLQALQVFANIKNDNPHGVYYTSNDKPASIMLQILLYSHGENNSLKYPYKGINPTDNDGNYGGHIEKDKSGANDVSGYKWKVHYYHPNLDKNIQHFYALPSPPVSPVTRGGGTRKKKTKRRSKMRKIKKKTRRKNTRRKNTKKNTRRKTKKNTRRKSRKNTQRTLKRRTKRSRRK